MNDSDFAPEREPAVPQRPGIFYENLALSQEEAALEQAAPVPREEPAPVLMVLGCVLLLLSLLVAAFFAGKTCDLKATALKSEGFSLTNESLAIYFWDTCREAAAAFRESGSAVPFDVYTDLDRQYYDVNSGYTWQDYFMAQAAQTAAVNGALIHAAKNAGYILPEPLQAQFAQTIAGLPELAKAAGCDTVPQYLHARYGKSVSQRAYEQYLFDKALADAYVSAVYDNLTFTDQQLAEAYSANLETYGALNLDTPNVDIRHMLFLPKDDTPSAQTQAKQEAEELLARCRDAGETEDAFVELVPKHSQDSGSSQKGGLVENLAPGTLGGSAESWLFAPERKRGDMAVLSSDYGWHVVYFVKQRDNYYWQDVVTTDLKRAAIQEFYRSLLEEHPYRLTPLADVTPLEP